MAHPPHLSPERDLPYLPPERDLPLAVRRELKGRVLAGLSGNTASGRGFAGVSRTGLATVVGVAVVAGISAVLATALVLTLAGHDGPDSAAGDADVVAIGQEGLSVAVRQASGVCLTEAYGSGRVRWQPGVRATLVNHAERHDRAVAIYRVDGQLVICAIEDTVSPTVTPGTAKSVSYTLLPPTPPETPLSVELVDASGWDGGLVTVAGRVDDRVASVALSVPQEHTLATIAGGTFAVVSEGLLVTKSAVLIAYDAGGEEISRLPLG